MTLQDIFYYAQWVVFILNILVSIYLFKHQELSYNLERIILVVIFTVMIVINFGKVSWVSVIFAFTPFIALIKIKPNGKLDRLLENIRSYFRSHKQHGKDLQRSNKAFSEQEA